MHTHTPTLRRWRLWSASALLAGSALLAMSAMALGFAQACFDEASLHA